MNRFLIIILLALAGCGGSAIPQPNSAQARFDPRSRAVQVLVSDVQPMSAAELVGPDGSRFQASALSLLSGPHVDYRPPPSIGIGIGGFGFGGGGGGFGSGVGFGMPIGGPTPTRVSDQFVASAMIPVPSDYAQRWTTFHVEMQVGNRPLVVPAPAP